MLHWVESQDKRGLDTWLRCISCSHWGLIVVNELPRWIDCIIHYERGIAYIRVP